MAVADGEGGRSWRGLSGRARALRVVSGGNFRWGPIRLTFWRALHGERRQCLVSGGYGVAVSSDRLTVL
jgi:hypothetical protein